MPIWRWFRPEPEPSESGMITFRRQLLLCGAVFTFYGVWLIIPWVTPPPKLSSEGYLTILWGTCLALATFFLRRPWPRLTSYFFVSGSLLLDALVFVTFRHYIAFPLLALAVLAGGLLLGPRPNVVIAAASALFVLTLSLGSSGPNPTWFWLLMILVMYGLGLLIERALELTDHWEREFALQQGQLVKELRDRQGELNRALKALDEAYVSLKRSRDELIVAREEAEEARALKEQFVANVSHELRTPLNLIVGFAEMMYLAPESYDGVGWTSDLQSDIGELYRASRHLQSLVNDILDLSRIDSARMPMFREFEDVRAVIADAGETLAPLLKQRGLSYGVEWPEELPRLFIDRTRIRQVMINLLNNAVRFTDKGGIRVKVEQTQDSVVVSVSDTGVGIPQDQLEHIFERFGQMSAGSRGRGGAGLGLTLSRQFVDLHGGRMWVESKAGVGSTFYFSLPLPGTLPQTASLLHTPDRKKADLAEAPVVVIDQDQTIADMLSRYLSNRPVLGAKDADEAELMVEAEHPLAVMVNLPPEAPFHEWLEPLGGRCQRYNVPVLRCSIPSPSWLRQPDGFDECLTKPISREALAQALREHLKRPGIVLVVDDDPGFVSLMARMLGTMSLASEAVTAHSGTQALRLAREKAPDLILLDLLMPEMDGFEVMRALRKDPSLRDTTVIAVTATSYAEDALQRRANRLTLTQPNGISTGRIVELLNAVLQVTRPSYVVGESTRPSA